jgi:hypothetical protein
MWLWFPSSWTNQVFPPSDATDKSLSVTFTYFPGLSIENLSKILKCAGNDDIITLQAEEEPSTVRFTFEGQSFSI